MPIIEVDHVTKEFNLGQLHSAKRRLERMIARMNGRRLPERQPFKALEDVDFRLEPGEVVGIIGSNGAGKSTLLKILSRITVPTKGHVVVRGKVAPLIEVGAGLVGELTGRENIYLNATILGMPKKTIAKKLDEIVAFSELEAFVDTPIKRYSSGMAVRLGFSIAASIDSDILIVDEVLAVGDIAFQRKCFDRMEELIKRQKKTVLLVSHNIRQVERLCTRVLLLDHGRIIKDGNATDVCNLFYERSDAKIAQVALDNATRSRQYESSGEVELLDVQMYDESGNPNTVFYYKSDVTVSVKYRVKVHLNNPLFGVGVHTSDFVFITTDHSYGTFSGLKMTPGIYEAKCHVTAFPLLPGVYALKVGLAAGEYSSTVFHAENVFFFRVALREGKRTQAMQEGFFAWESKWSAARIEHDSDAHVQQPLQLLE
jgi:ABC-type polysaccharide/polyol phosphate transport system ATPase subunit